MKFSHSFIIEVIINHTGCRGIISDLVKIWFILSHYLYVRMLQKLRSCGTWE